MKQLKVIEILEAITENEGTHLWLDDGSGYPKSYIYESIKELEELQNENKSLVKTLEKYNKEMIELRKQNQDLLNTIIEAQEAIKNILEGKK